MEATLETVLKSIANPGLLAPGTSAGMLTEPAFRSPAPSTSHLQPDTLSFGASPPIPVSSAGSSGRDRATSLSMNPQGLPGAHQRATDQVHFDKLEWDTTIRGVEHNQHQRGPSPLNPHQGRNGESNDNNPRLHSLPDNTLNPLGLLAE